jgi:3-carboxy-cis,cis-muconate cycloisomerase
VVNEGVSDRAWLAAMLDVEKALAIAGERAGVVPSNAAAEIALACDPDAFDTDDVGRRAVRSGNPVVPLAADLEQRVSSEARPYVHLGATSQDILDTAMSLVARRALTGLLDDLDGVADHCARLADSHRSTLMAGRTLLQQAVPTAFGLRCAGWLVAVDESMAHVLTVRDSRLAIQLGGAAGTLASLGKSGVAVAHYLALELGLAEPVVAWHTNRVRVAELATALGIVSGVLGKIALDVELLAQTELAEVVEEAEGDGAASSTLPQKRNPVHAVLVTSAARRAPSLVATVLTAMPQEHERAAGSWHAEWETISDLLRIAGGAATHTRSMLTRLVVDPARMRAAVELTRGLIMAESIATRLAPSLGRSEAQALVQRCCRESLARQQPLRDVLLGDPGVREHLIADDIDHALDPDSYLGASDALIDRALEQHRSRQRRPGQSHQPLE